MKKHSPPTDRSAINQRIATKATFSMLSFSFSLPCSLFWWCTSAPPTTCGIYIGTYIRYVSVYYWAVTNDFLLHYYYYHSAKETENERERKRDRARVVSMISIIINIKIHIHMQRTKYPPSAAVLRLTFEWTHKIVDWLCVLDQRIKLWIKLGFQSDCTLVANIGS